MLKPRWWFETFKVQIISYWRQNKVTKSQNHTNTIYNFVKVTIKYTSYYNKTRFKYQIF